MRRTPFVPESALRLRTTGRTCEVWSGGGAVVVLHVAISRQLGGEVDDEEAATRGSVPMSWALEFRDIPATLTVRADLRERMIRLLDGDMPQKASEGDGRLQQLRLILADLINGTITVPQAFTAVSQHLPRSTSPHASSNSVFASGWEERLVRTQFSRLYSQAVLDALADAGEAQCFVAHSSEESQESPCSMHLAGQVHEIAILRERLISNYVQGLWSKELKIPNHPHCTHVVGPPPR